MTLSDPRQHRHQLRHDSGEWRIQHWHLAQQWRRRPQRCREFYRRHCFQSGVDYVPLDTSMQFDRALTEYLLSRRTRC